MAISRNFTLVVHFFLDQLLPPIIRDNRWLMALLMNLSLGKDSIWLREFKDLAPGLASQDMEAYYRKSAGAHLDRETDLNSACTDAVLESISGTTVLDVACGRGYLTKLLAEKYTVTGADFVIDENLKMTSPEVTWDQASVEKLHYADDQFDTVVCAHTLEHIIDVHAAISELRRIANKKLIIVLPRQRAYQYTFDLHVHFFSYQWQVEMLMKSDDIRINGCCRNIQGDWVYIEQYNTD